MNDTTKSFWGIAYKRNIAKMIGVCLRYTQNRQIAEDLAHDAFMVAMDKFSTYTNKGPFEAWLRRIVVNVALQYLRERKKYNPLEIRIDTTLLPDATPLLEIYEDNLLQDYSNVAEADLLNIIGHLPEHHRLVFNLYVMDNYTHAQIGAQLGISEGTSKSHLARARKKIKELLVTKTGEKTRRKHAFWFFLLSYKLWGVDFFCKQQLGSLAISPQKTSSFQTENFRNVYNPQHISSPTIPKLYWNISTGSIITVSIVAISVLLSYSDSQPKTPVKVENPVAIASGNIPDSVSSNYMVNHFSNTKTATISENAIIHTENSKPIEKMRPLHTLGLLLIPAISLDSTALQHTISDSLKNQKIPSVSVVEPPTIIQQEKPATKTGKERLSGTFYASKLSWSPADRGLILKGSNVRVNMNTQKFKGDGTFSFINHIDYLVVDGTPMKLDQTIELSDKKYQLNELSEQEIAKKYGDKKMSVVVEISLAE
ncbi:sigma-70 family RNA polymerase sigma factor [Xanthocytophaga agilis]|uniref:Sigma-70 family RNA polymerase sigma factor n=1 Tax=Xanthocytophaga agilis TaxID=3048010 RepID=A0AAE3QYX5_9BACT|nr:sigma-70 family RNA polymerase sigma factor [Xanthocytophaga agilis]MDJ1500030.1 sigma-70 family RNA polymerase sigma factor [Xanthocytophaga agilis]